MGKVLKSDATADNAYARFDFGSPQSTFWLTYRLYLPSAAITYWTSAESPPRSGYFTGMFGAGIAVELLGLVDVGSGLHWTNAEAASSTAPTGGAWLLVEHLFTNGGPEKVYVGGSLVIDTTEFNLTDIDYVEIGQNLDESSIAANAAQIVYFDDVTIGTTRGGTELFGDTFEGGDLSAWSSTFGAVSVVDDPFADASGVFVAFDDPIFEVSPTWTRLDDPDGYRLATGWEISRGRQSETDKTVTGTATLYFADTQGTLDPTNPSSPFSGNLDPMKQAQIWLQNPITEETFSLFRGYVGDLGNELQMFELAERGLDLVAWNLVDAFDVFANIILTRGVHGHTPALSTFPNIYYQGTPANLSGESDVFVHVDQRFAKQLDDAGWSGTGNTIDVDNLRNVFSGNVSVQGTVMARQDSLMQAIYETADAEFPEIANVFMSKDGVFTFHGRFARFFPDRPGYGINQWYVGGYAEALADPDVVPLAGQIQFYRSKDDVINLAVALPQGVDETDVGVVIASDATSITKYGFRSTSYPNLLTSAGHDDDLSPTTAVEECNKFSAYKVGNCKDPHTRVSTLRFRTRSAEMVGATALWDFMTRVELGDVITLTTGHVGGGGFGDDFYVEHLHYVAAPLRDDLLDITLEVEVSPATFFAYNPFGTVDEGVS